MTSPSMVHRSGDTLVVRSVVSGNQLFVDDNEAERYSEDASEDIDYCDEFFDPDDNKNLPECKIRRNYSCVSCHFFTQNPRHYLYHLRDVHKEKVKIYECSNCLYASKHFQKLLRHTKMVHGSLDNSEVSDSTHRQKVRRKRKRPSDEDTMDPELSAEEAEGDEDDVHRIGDIVEDSASSKSTTDLKCSLCPFTTKHQGQLTKHEKQEHIKTKFFRCTKCSYVTHIKARFTKHVKYHSMPMIKCDLCDFRTPYKWNLDRHYKNHNGHGAFRCSACNFTADIKQSLTVHEMNHHVPPVGQAAGLGVGRRRNKVGASDTTAAEEAAAMAAQAAAVAADPVPATPRDATQGITPEKQENLNETNRKSPKIKISFKKAKSTSTQEQNERHNFETDFIHPDDIIHHSNGNIYIKNKCKLCNYKTAWDTEMARHERKVHNIIRDNGQQNNVAVKKTPRPIPNLIPIQSSQPSQAMSASSLLKIPHVQNRPANVHGQFLPKADEYLAPPDNVMSQKDLNDMCAKSANSSLRDFASLFGDDVVFGNEKPTAVPAVPAADAPEPKTLTAVAAAAPAPLPAAVPANSALFKKKNASFFDKLKEKLMTGESCNLTCKWCGHESKCLSESAGHQKTCGKQQSSASSLPASATTTSSTRCQHCRQRCKSSIDLHNHLQVCSEANKHNDTFGYNFEKPDITIKLEDEHVPEDSLEPHPMENVVFVWNNISPSPQPPDIEDHNLSERLEDNSLDLSIRVQSPESEGSFMECENVSGNVSGPAKMPTHGNNIDLVTEGRRVFKCPHCSFWATTASRFHVHIVGHLNKKPFECSLCAYRSNWRWDITKHIRLKSVRDPAHEKARVLMTDETGRRNYSKYNKYLTQLRPNESPQENNSPGRRSKSNYEANQGNVTPEKSVMELPKLTRAPTNTDLQTVSGNNPLRPPPPLKAANEMYFQSFNEQKKRRTSADSKKTLFKCKKCNFRDASRDNILLHVKGHYRQENNVPGNADTDEASVSRGQAPFRCGHCHQVSNWKHVIQRHCRLKHSGDVRVVIGGKNGTSDKIEIDDQTDEPDHMDVIQSGVFKCKQCPYSTNIQPDFDNHLELHISKSTSTIKCYFCPYYVTQKFELFDHLRLHGVSNPEDYVNRAMQGRELASPTEGLYKRYKCVMCPYVSNSKSQFLYHKQFHRHRGGPFKCDYCSYNVTRRHLLHQHMKVHGINIPHNKNSFRSGSDRESDAMDSEDFGLDEFEEVMSPSEMISTPEEQIPADVPLVWVSREDKFSKMYKCRYCPHVNLRKVNIQEHEKMHMQRNPNSPRTGDEHACNECSYVCNNAGVLSSHLKVHQSIYGQIHCLVDTEKTDEEQISELSRLLNVSSSDSNNYSTDTINDSTKIEEINGLDDQDKNLLDFTINDDHVDRVLFFCEHCPARFLHEKEYNIHIKFHGIRLFYRCDYCTYAARQRPHLLSHNKVHTDEYQEKTKHYQSEYPISPEHPPPRTAVIVDAPGNNNGAIWVVISSVDRKTTFTDNEISVIKSEVANGRQSNKNFACIKCPARFFKDELLQYHMTLHGCKNPYKCKFCDYAARTSSNLQKHVRIHEQYKLEMILAKPMSATPVVPLSGTDLFQQKSEAQRQNTENSQQDELPGIPMHVDPQFGTLSNGNPKFIYPTYLKNGRMKEKRYKCHKCPSAFEKREQYKVHLSLHGSKQRYKCENCDYSVKYYANYIQHIRKHQMNEDALAAKKSEVGEYEDEEEVIWKEEPSTENIISPPFSKLAIKTLNSSAKRGPLKLSVADRQTLMILQQRRTSSASSTKESTTEDKKLFWCPHCPYTNYRRDAVDNHVNRHICVSGVRSNYTCDHCDYTVPQSHFLREHVKIHFAGQKTHLPEGFMVCDNLQLSSTCVDETDNTNSDESVIFHDCGDSKSDQTRFKPVLESEPAAVNNNNEKIYVNPENGEFLENSSGKSETKESKKSL